MGQDGGKGGRGEGGFGGGVRRNRARKAEPCPIQPVPRPSGPSLDESGRTDPRSFRLVGPAEPSRTLCRSEKLACQAEAKGRGAGKREGMAEEGQRKGQGEGDETRADAGREDGLC